MNLKASKGCFEKKKYESKLLAESLAVTVIHFCIWLKHKSQL